MMQTVPIAVYAVFVATLVCFGVAVWLRLPRNLYRPASAVSAWLLAGAVTAAIWETQFVYLAALFLYTTPAFAALAFVRDRAIAEKKSADPAESC